MGTYNIAEDSCIHEKSVLETNMEPRFQPPDYEDSLLGSKWPTAKNPLEPNILLGDCPFPQESPYQDLLKRKIIFNKRKRYHSLKFVLRLAKCLFSFEENFLNNFFLKIEGLDIFSFSDIRAKEDKKIFSLIEHKDGSERNRKIAHIAVEYSNSKYSSNKQIVKVSIDDSRIDIDIDTLFLLESFFESSNILRHFLGNEGPVSASTSIFFFVLVKKISSVR